MGEFELTNLLGVCAIAFLAPLALGLAPALRLPAVVLEIVLGIVVGPDVLGWVAADEPVAVLATIGLAMLLFLAGLELQPSALRGEVGRLALIGFGLSFGLALLVGLALAGAGVVRSPVFPAIVLSATSLGVVVPVLKDAGLAAAPLGQLVIAAASIADVATIVLLTLLFSSESGSVTAQALLLGGLGLTAAVVVLGAVLAEHWSRLSAALLRLQDTTAQIRVRGAFVLLVGFAALAQELGLEVILGAFIAGMLLTVVDRDREMTHPDFRLKLEAIGFGVLIPIFFVTSGLRFDLAALTADASALAKVPLFLAALLVVRALPAVLYRGLLHDRQAAVAGLLQATSLPFIVASTAIGLELGLLSAATAAGLVAAGLLSVLLFPLLSLAALSAPRAAAPASP
ncbi:MAG TPA: cation:proton antiporter [Solirubrobacteraceae bacterium]